jgi:hypothetical protein
MTHTREAALRAALAEARRLAATAGRLQARLRDHLATSYPLRSK